MADGRDVTLKIKVDDNEVDKGVASLNRLKAAANDVGSANAFGGKKPVENEEQRRRLAAFMAKDLPQASKAATEAVDAVSTASEGMSTSLLGVGSAAGIAVGAIVLIVAAAAALAYGFAKASVEVFNLAKRAAEYGVEIGKSMDATGLAAGTVAALRHEADRTGTSFGLVESAAASFRKTIGEAAAGSDKARASLHSLGIDGSKAIYDVDTAFRQAVATIVKAPPGLEQARAAFAAFGEDGYKLIPFFQSFHGNVDEAIKRANELGIVLGGKDVAASREFTKYLEDAKAAVSSLGLTFGREFLPTVTGVLRDFNGFIKDNRSAIRDWATWTGNAVKGVVDGLREIVKFVEDHPYLIKGGMYVARAGAAVVTGGASEGLINGAQVFSALGAAGRPPTSTTFDYSRPQDAKPDMAALEAARAEQERKLAETVERTKRSWEAAIESWQLYGSEAGKSLSDVYSKLKEQFDKIGDAEQFQSGVKAAVDKYLAEINRAYTELEKLEDEKDRRNKATENEVNLTNQKQLARRREYSDAAVKVQQQANDLISQAQKKADKQALNDERRAIEDALAEMAIAGRRRLDLQSAQYDRELEQRKESLAVGLITEQQFLDYVKEQEMFALTSRQKELQAQLAKVNQAANQRPDIDGSLAKRRADLEGQIAVLKVQIGAKAEENERRLTPMLEAQRDIRREINRMAREDADVSETAARRRVVASNQERQIKQHIRELNDDIANGGVNDALIIEAAHLQDVLDLRDRELNAVIAVNRAQLQLAHSMEISNNQIRASVYEHLAQQKTLSEGIADGINKTYDAIADKMDEQIDKAFKWAGVFKSLITEPLKAIARDSLTKVTTGLLDIFIPGLGSALTKTTNPIARPIVDKLDQIHTTLKSMSAAGSANSIAAPGFGNIFGGGSGSPGGGIFGSILNALGLGGRGGAGASIFSSTAGATGSIDAAGNYVVNGSQAAGAFGSLGSIGSALMAGAPAALVGLFISSLSEKSPLKGALKGGLVGFLAGLFNRTKLRRQEETIRNQGMLDAQASITQQFADLMASVRQGSDPAAAIAQGTSIGQQIRAQYLQMANSLTDKKTRNIALGDVSRVDSLIAQKMAELKDVADRAQAASDRMKRILPEFAGGTYFADFFRPNGLIPGVFDGRDDMLAMLSRGEMVLNPTQQNNIRRSAGRDIFQDGGIPNYPRSSPSPKLAGGGIASSGLSLMAGPTNVTVNPQLTLVLEGVSHDERTRAYLEGDDGTRTLVRVLTRETGLKSK